MFETGWLPVARALGFLMLSTVAAACVSRDPGALDDVDPSAMSLNRSYSLQWCNDHYQPGGHGQPHAPPCITYSRASRIEYVDSGRVALLPNHAARWMVAFHQYGCPCYLGTCNLLCSHGPITHDTASGTYQFRGDTLVLDLPPSGLYRGVRLDDVRLLAPNSARVGPRWSGPDSLLSINMCLYVANCLVFRPG